MKTILFFLCLCLPVSAFEVMSVRPASDKNGLDVIIEVNGQAGIYRFKDQKDIDLNLADRMTKLEAVKEEAPIEKSADVIKMEEFISQNPTAKIVDIETFVTTEKAILLEKEAIIEEIPTK